MEELSGGKNISSPVLHNDTKDADRIEAKLTVGVENLYPALIECFGIIALGYLAGR